MPTKIAWLAGLGIAVTMVLVMRSEGYDWIATVITAAVIFVFLADVLLRERSHQGF